MIRAAGSQESFRERRAIMEIERESKIIFFSFSSYICAYIHTHKMLIHIINFADAERHFDARAIKTDGGYVRPRWRERGITNSRLMYFYLKKGTENLAETCMNCIREIQ